MVQGGFNDGGDASCGRAHRFPAPVRESRVRFLTLRVARCICATPTHGQQNGQLAESRLTVELQMERIGIEPMTSWLQTRIIGDSRNSSAFPEFHKLLFQSKKTRYCNS